MRRPNSAHGVDEVLPWRGEGGRRASCRLGAAPTWGAGLLATTTGGDAQRRQEEDRGQQNAAMAY
jgi:hypothetical protein